MGLVSSPLAGILAETDVRCAGEGRRVIGGLRRGGAAERGLQRSRWRDLCCRRAGGAGLLAGVGLIVALAGCQGEGDPLPLQEGAGQLPLQVVEGMELRESESGRLRWRLVADSALTFAGDEGTLLRGVQVEFYSEGGDSVESTLTSLEGEVDQRRGNLFARGNVIIVTAEGHRLETEELRWDNERGKVVSNSFVRLTKGSSVITGVGIETDAELRSYVIQSRVEGALQEEDRILDEF